MTEKLVSSETAAAAGLRQESRAKQPKLRLSRQSLKYIAIAAGGLVIIAIAIFVIMRLVHNNNPDAVIREAADNLFKYRSSSASIELDEKQFSGATDKYTASLQTASSGDFKFSIKDTDTSARNGIELASGTFISSQQKLYFQPQIKHARSFAKYDFSKVNGNWYRVDDVDAQSSDSGAFNIIYNSLYGGLLPINYEHLRCLSKTSASVKPNELSELEDTLLNAKFFKLQGQKSDKNGHYYAIAIDTDKLGDLAKSYTNTKFYQRQKKCFSESFSDPIASSEYIKQFSASIKPMKPELKLYISGFTSSRLKRLEFSATASKDASIKLVATDTSKTPGNITVPNDTKASKELVQNKELLQSIDRVNSGDASLQEAIQEWQDRQNSQGTQVDTTSSDLPASQASAE